MTKSIVFLYTTVPNKATAISLARALLEKRLIACANFTCGNSLYFWEEIIKEEEEFFLLMKTSQSLVKKIKKTILLLHPYKIPCLVEINIKNLNPAFADWVLNQI
jgi:periplasmic divalent cation tolerance protein